MSRSPILPGHAQRAAVFFSNLSPNLCLSTSSLHGFSQRLLSTCPLTVSLNSSRAGQEVWSDEGRAEATALWASVVAVMKMPMDLNSFGSRATALESEDYEDLTQVEVDREEVDGAAEQTPTEARPEEVTPAPSTPAPSPAPAPRTSVPGTPRPSVFGLPAFL